MEGCGQESSRFLVGSRPSGTARQRAASRESLRRGTFGRRRKRMWSFAFAIPQFSRAFRKAVGIPPHRWVIQERITLAKTLLRMLLRRFRKWHWRAVSRIKVTSPAISQHWSGSTPASGDDPWEGRTLPLLPTFAPNFPLPAHRLRRAICFSIAKSSRTDNDGATAVATALVPT